MAAVGRTDEMIRDYLLFRGFTSTLKAFDTDLKNEREKGFRGKKYLRGFCGVQTFDFSFSVYFRTYNNVITSMNPKASQVDRSGVTIFSNPT